MTDQTVWDYLVAFVTFAALAIGLISMAVGQLAAWRDRRTARRRRVLPRARMRVVRQAGAPVRAMPEPAEPLPVRSQQHQAEPIEPVENEPVREPLQLNRLSRAAEIALLAVQRNEDGSYRHSANAITQFVGGTAADVKRQIAEIRATKPEEPPKPESRIDRPARGWPKTA